MEPAVPGAKPPHMRYQPQLDGLRFVAIFGVLLDHFGLELPNELHYGQLGVRLFFILSGYFITLSLWKEQVALGTAARSIVTFAGAFYLKRFCRIAPAYYFVLILGLCLGYQQVRDGILFHLTFTTNFYIVQTGYWPGVVSHFWTLAVQEQFYLLWPFVILLFPRRKFYPAMVLFIVGAILFRLICIETQIPVIAKWTMLPGCIDSFAAGAIVAGARLQGFTLRAFSRPQRCLIGLGAFACVASARGLGYLPENSPFLAISETLDTAFLIWIFISVMDGLPGPFGRLLASRPLTYLGKISYGLYIYHVFVIVMVEPLLKARGLSIKTDPWICATILSALTIAGAMLSYHLLERPFLRMKDHVLDWFAQKGTVHQA